MNPTQNSTVYTTDTTADFEQYKHSGRDYSPQAETLIKSLIQGGKHAKTAIKTIAGIAKLDIDKADKVYKSLRVAGLALPSVVLFMLNAPTGVLLATLTGAGVGLLGNKGAKEAQKVKDQRTREQVALELASQYNGRIQHLENHIEDSKMKIKAKFEAFQFLYKQKMEGLHDEIATQQALIIEQSTQLNQNEEAKRLLEQDLKKQFGAEVEHVIAEANQKIEIGNQETQKALSLRDNLASRLKYADQLCRKQSQTIAQLAQEKEGLKNGAEIDQKHAEIEAENKSLISELEAIEKALEEAKATLSQTTEEAENAQKTLKSEIKDLRRMANIKEEIIKDMGKLSQDNRLQAENEALKAELKEERAENKRLNSEVVSSKDETITAQQEQIRVLEFALKYATIHETPDTGDQEGKTDSKRYTAIIEGIEIGAIKSIAQNDLRAFSFAGKSMSARVATKYQQALVRDGYAEKGAGGFKLVAIK